MRSNTVLRANAERLYQFTAPVPADVGLGVNVRIVGVQQFRFDGKRVLVIGGATGMARPQPSSRPSSAARSLCSTSSRSPSPLERCISVDLSDKASVDTALAQLSGQFDVLFS